MVDQGLGEAARPGEVGHRGAEEAVPGEQGRGSGHDRLAPLLVVGRLFAGHGSLAP